MLRAALLVLLALVALTAWTGYRAARGALELRAAGDDLRAAQAAPDDYSAATASIARASERTRAASEHLGDPVLRLATALPLVGRPLQAASALATSADTAVREALLPLAGAAGSDPAERALREGGQLDLAYLGSLAAPSRVASERLGQARAQLARAPRGSGVGVIDRAHTDYERELTRLDDVVDDLAAFTRVAPALLGREGLRRYLLVPQNPAEARGATGLIGGYVLLEADGGRVRLLQSGSNNELRPPRGTEQVDLGPEYQAHWGANRDRANWSNTNLSPHFPYAARSWLALWEAQTGQRLDGAAALDPVGLSYLMAASGPVTLSDGTRVTARNVVDVVLRDAYAKFGPTDRRRDAYLQEVSSQVAKSVTTKQVSGRRLLEGFARAAGERRLLFWTRDETVMEALGPRRITGMLRADQKTLGAVVNNGIASKLDYYLSRTSTYRPGCGRGPSRLTMAFANGAPKSGLPDYVSLDLYRQGLPVGTNRWVTTVYLPAGSTPGRLTLDGRAGTYRQGTELGLVWVEGSLEVGPGATSTLELEFTEKGNDRGDVAWLDQPIVRPQTLRVVPCADR